MLVKAKKAASSGRGTKPEDRPVQDLLRHGVVVIDKPSGPTSHQVTAWTRDIAGAETAAHGGTLDPRVTGVLPVGLGDAVRAVDALHFGTKAYVGVMRLHGNADLKRVAEVFSEFQDEVFQTPPMRSAVKREMRKRRVHSLRLLENSARDLLFDVECDAGTYIRSLCVDMGDALGVGAHLQDLRRTRAGALTEEQAVSLHDFKDAVELFRSGDDKELREMLRPMEVLLAQVQKVVVKDSAVDAVCHGADLAVPGVVAVDDHVAKGDIIAMMTLDGEGVGLGTAMMGAEEMVRRQEGVAVDTTRVFMKRGTYERIWGGKQAHD